MPIILLLLALLPCSAVAVTATIDYVDEEVAASTNALGSAAWRDSSYFATNGNYAAASALDKKFDKSGGTITGEISLGIVGWSYNPNVVLGEYRGAWYYGENNYFITFPSIYKSGTLALISDIPNYYPYTAITNAPWITSYTESDPIWSADKPYYCTIAALNAATNALPAWTKTASKPTYTLNEIAPNAENWLGVQGNAGRIIKILAQGSPPAGGVQVTASTLNNNNMTTYTYGGVAVRRSGVNQDYLFDDTSNNGIIRRSQLASAIAPLASTNDLATVQSAISNKYDKSGGTISGNVFVNGTLSATQGFELGYGLGRGHIDEWGVYLDGEGSEYGVKIAFPSKSGTFALTNDVASATNSLASVAFSGSYDDLIDKPDIPDIPSYTVTNTTAVIVYNYGKETVSIPAGATLTANTANWNDGEQCFVVLSPAGAYSVDTSVLKFNGYGLWPTNDALCVAWRFGSTVYVNPISIRD